MCLEVVVVSSMFVLLTSTSVDGEAPAVVAGIGVVLSSDE